MHRPLLAEALGTFWLVLTGCGSAVLAAGFPEVGIGLLGGDTIDEVVRGVGEEVADVIGH